MMNPAKVPDLLKIGVFMLGIAAVVFAALAVHAYYTIQTSINQYSQSGFYAYCTDNRVIISAQKDVSDVTVTGEDGSVICGFDSIMGGSDELCNAGQEGIFTVKAQGEKKVVVCEETKVPQQVAAGD